MPCAVVWLWFCTVPLPVAAPVRATAEVDRPRITLAESVRLTLTIEGPANLTVELPSQLLSREAHAIWRIREADGGRVQLTPLPDGRQQWKRVYQLDAFALSHPPNTPLPLVLNPVWVNRQQVHWEPEWLGVVVDRIGGESAPTEQTPFPITGIEELPPPAPFAASPSPWPWIALAVLGVVLGAAVLMGWRRRPPVPVSAEARALAALEKLAGSCVPVAQRVEEVAAIVREFIESRFAIAASKQTTAELLAAATEQGWPVEPTHTLRLLLEECDRAKFAGNLPDDDGCRRLIGRAWDWINDIGRPTGPR